MKLLGRRTDYLLALLAILLILFCWRKFIFFCTPVESERMLGYYHFAKKVILQYHSFPHFLLGYTEFRYTYEQFKTYEYFSFPESPLLTPFFILYLFTGILKAEKLSIALHIIFGIIGIFLTGKYLKLSRGGTFIFVILFSNSTNLTSMYASGHINWKTIYLFPWVFYFLLRAYEDKKFVLLSALINLLILFEGGIHIFIWSNLFVGFYGIFQFLETRKISEILLPLKFFLFELLLGSIKIIPMCHFFGGYKPPESTIDLRAGIAPPYLIRDFITALTTPFFGAEYSNYIGIIPIFLFIFAIFYGLKYKRPLLFTSLFFTLLTLKLNGISLFYLMRKLPVLNTQRIPPRFFVMAIFGFALLSGLMLTHLQQKIEKIGKRAVVLFEIFLMVLISYIYLDQNKALNFFQRGCNPLGFEEPLIFFNYIPKIVPEGKCIQEFSKPNSRIWKIKLKEDAQIIFEGLEWKLYRNVLKFEIYRNRKFKKINSQPYNGYVSLKIPKDATILRMEYDSPYFRAGLAITLISILILITPKTKKRVFKTD